MKIIPNNIIFLFFNIGFFSIGFAQVKQDLTVIASAGNSYKSNDIWVDWTLGETIILYGDANNAIKISQGFQQPMVCKSIPILNLITKGTCKNAYLLTVNSGFDYYRWNFENGFIVNHKTNNYIPVENGNYSATVGDSTGCLITSNIKSVDFQTKNIKPIISISSTNELDTMLTSSEAETYQWYFMSKIGPKAIINANSKNYKPLISGEYFVKINLKDYCVAISDFINVKASNDNEHLKFEVLYKDSTIKFELKNLVKNDFKLYPNPAKDNINIDYFSSDAEFIVFEIYNIYGILLLKEQKPNSNGNFSYNIKNLYYPNGIYIFKLIANNKTITQNFVIE